MRLLFLLLTTFFPFSLFAVNLEIDMGAGVHYAGAKGTLVYTKELWKDSSGVIDHEVSTNGYMWINIKPDEKYWPNVRLEVTQYKSSGDSFIHIVGGSLIDGLISAIETQVPLVSINDRYYSSRLTLNEYEAFFFYDFYTESKNASCGVGFGLKKFVFDYSVTIIDGLAFSDNGGGTAPLLFFTSAYKFSEKSEEIQSSVSGDAKVYVFGDSTIYEYLVKLDFTKQYNATTELGIEMGFKETYYDIQGSDIVNVGGNMKSAGAFVGIVARFK